MSSLCSSSSSEKLDLPDSVARKRRKLMLDNAKAVNSSTNESDASQREHALNGLWNTLITTANAHEMKSFMKKSPTIMGKVIPNIVNSAVQQYEHSHKNMIRSVGVLYEGEISSKKQFNLKRSREIFELDDNGKRHRVTYMPACKSQNLWITKEL